jgi:amino acid transporter
MRAVFGATSIAVLSYIGFDGISTLSEEAENPRRNILLATVLTCFAIGILSALEVYAAQLIWPSSKPFPNSDTAFAYVAGHAWAPLFGVVGFTLLVANFGSGMGAQIGAARLLFGMGRSKALPESFFGAVDPKRHVPRNNVLFVGALALIGALLVEIPIHRNTVCSVGQGVSTLFCYGLGAQMLNFGALIAFMGVNLAAFVHYFLRQNQRTFLNLTAPLAGFLICLALFLGLSTPAKIVGVIWLVVGFGFGAWKTRFFRGALINFDLPEENS